MIQKAGRVGNVRVFLSLGFTLDDRHDILREVNATMQFSSSSCEYFCNLVNNANAMSFDSNTGKHHKESNIK